MINTTSESLNVYGVGTLLEKVGKFKSINGNPPAHGAYETKALLIHFDYYRNNK